MLMQAGMTTLCVCVFTYLSGELTLCAQNWEAYTPTLCLCVCLTDTADKQVWKHCWVDKKNGCALQKTSCEYLFAGNILRWDDDGFFTYPKVSLHQDADWTLHQNSHPWESHPMSAETPRDTKRIKGCLQPSAAPSPWRTAIYAPAIRAVSVGNT